MCWIKLQYTNPLLIIGMIIDSITTGVLGRLIRFAEALSCWSSLPPKSQNLDNQFSRRYLLPPELQWTSCFYQTKAAFRCRSPKNKSLNKDKGNSQVPKSKKQVIPPTQIPPTNMDCKTDLSSPFVFSEMHRVLSIFFCPCRDLRLRASFYKRWS